MITIKNLKHDFRDTRALDDISFEIRPGVIAALIGPNGSGKTTLLRCISTLQSIQSGEIFINGIDITEHPREIHKHIGYLADNFGLYDDLTVYQCLQFTASSRLPEIEDTDELIRKCALDAGVSEFIDRKVNTLSRGMRQRVGIAQAIVHNPKVLLLDEPASGLDPEARIALSELLISLKQKGMTLLVSSHILAELEDYSTEMLILREGKLVEHSVLHQDSAGNTEAPLKLLMRVKAANLNPELCGLLTITFPAISKTELLDGSLTFSLAAEETKPHEILAFLLQQGIVVDEFIQVKRNLQDEYLKTIKNS
jgi:ABC-2 type transport system ATP-binding protein